MNKIIGQTFTFLKYIFFVYNAFYHHYSYYKRQTLRTCRFIHYIENTGLRTRQKMEIFLCM